MTLFQKKRLACFLVGIASLISTHASLSADANFKVTNLVSDIPGVAPNTDPNLLNPWGLTFDTLGNLVVADNGTSLATSYTPNGSILFSFVVNVPSDPTGL